MTTSTTSWDPGQYLKFEAERARPFHDLVAQVAHRSPTTVVDLGCGPGHLTATLAERWPAARVTGVDSSAEMIEATRDVAVPGRLEFTLGTIEDRRRTPPSISSSPTPRYSGCRPTPTCCRSGCARRSPPAGRSPSRSRPRATRQRASPSAASPDHPAGPAGSSRSPSGAAPPAARPGAPARPVPRPARPRRRPGQRLGDHVPARAAQRRGRRPPGAAVVRRHRAAPLLRRAGQRPSGGRRIPRGRRATLREAYPSAPYGTVLPFRRLFVVAELP